MKNLIEYLNEKLIDDIEVLNDETIKEEKLDVFTFKFDLSSFDGYEDVIKSLKENDVKSDDDKNIEFSLTEKDTDSYDTVIDMLQQYYEQLKKSSKFSSDESYASKVSKFGKEIGNLNDFIDKSNEEE